MNGFNVSEAGHVAVILPPQSISGGSGLINPAFAMKNYKHASILVIAGAEATQDTSTLTVSLCSSAAGAGATAIPFNYYFQSAGGAGNDVLGSINNATSSGVTLSSANWPPNGLIVIEIDANELESSTVGGVLDSSLGVDSYVGITINGPSAVDLACVVVVLSGARYSNVASPSVTV